MTTKTIFNNDGLARLSVNSKNILSCSLNTSTVKSTMYDESNLIGHEFISKNLYNSYEES